MLETFALLEKGSFLDFLCIVVLWYCGIFHRFGGTAQNFYLGEAPFEYGGLTLKGGRIRGRPLMIWGGAGGNFRNEFFLSSRKK